ncbi:hypothetical protein ACLOJK_021626 [Asimina triloba]
MAFPQKGCNAWTCFALSIFFAFCMEMLGEAHHCNKEETHPSGEIGGCYGPHRTTQHGSIPVVLAHMLVSKKGRGPFVSGVLFG